MGTVYSKTESQQLGHHPERQIGAGGCQSLMPTDPEQSLAFPQRTHQANRELHFKSLVPFGGGGGASGPALGCSPQENDTIWPGLNLITPMKIPPKEISTSPSSSERLQLICLDKFKWDGLLNLGTPCQMAVFVSAGGSNRTCRFLFLFLFL